MCFWPRLLVSFAYKLAFEVSWAIINGVTATLMVKQWILECLVLHKYPGLNGFG